MDQDLWLKALHFHGPRLLQATLGEIPDSEIGVERDILNMCRFIKEKLHILFKPCGYSGDPLPAPSIPVVPIELFQESSPTDRRDSFYKSLDRGNILILRVINDTLPDYKLLVLCKQENCLKLDDLSIIMYLPKLPAELEKASGKLESNDLIRAAVCSCSIDERKLYVTLDSNILEDETDVQLGKISEEDLPFYFEKMDLGTSYVEYLHHHSNFSNPNWAEELYTSLDLDKNYLYSFMENYDGRTYVPIVYASELKKKQVLALSNAHHVKAVVHYENGNFPDAFTCFNQALSIFPKNIEALVARGTLYSNTNNLRKAFVDVEQALAYDPEHAGARKQMSVLLVSVARMHIENDDMAKARESLDYALNLDSNNKDAISAVDEIRQKVSASDKPEKASKAEKKARIRSGSSDSSSSKKDDFKEKKQSFLEVSTRAFLSSMKKRHHPDQGKKSRHHSRHKSRSKSPKRKSNPS